MGFLSHGGAAVYRGQAITKILIGNSIARGWLKPANLWASGILRGLPLRYSWVPRRVGRWGQAMAGWDPAIRSLAYPGSWLPSSLGALGSDRLAAIYGGLTHSRQVPARAVQANLFSIGKNVYKDARLLGGGKAGALIDGLKATGKAGGFLRAAGVFGGIYSTVYSAVNVYKQETLARILGIERMGRRMLQTGRSLDSTPLRPWLWWLRTRTQLAPLL